MGLQHKVINATHSWASHYSITCPLGTIDIVIGQMLKATVPLRASPGQRQINSPLSLSCPVPRSNGSKRLRGCLGGKGGRYDGGTVENSQHMDLIALYTIMAMFSSPLAAQNASLCLNNSVSHFKLQVAKNKL